MAHHGNPGDAEPPLGLSHAEAHSRLAKEGYNELPQSQTRSIWRIARDIVSEPMFGLLIGAGLVYLLLGDLTEAVVLLLFACASVTIAIVQEARSERVLESLRDLTSPRALVVRDGHRQRIAGRELVRGDLVVLNEGDRVPADAMVQQAHDLQVDESLLTGESVPVRKAAAGVQAAAVVGPRPGGDGLPYVYSGTLVVHGFGFARVTATGARSEIGRIGAAIKTIEAEPPRLHAETRRLVQVFALLGIGFAAFATVLNGVVRGDWLEALLGGIALSMSMLPEEFPLVLAVFMVMGAWRISQARVLTRRAAAIETLGAATVLCTDKTGTLTQNRMSVAVLAVGETVLRPGWGGGGPLGGDIEQLLETAILASEPEALDPMERALHTIWREQRGAAALPTGGLRLLRDYELRPDLLAMTHVWESADRTFAVATKGSPEAVASLCRLPPEDRAALEAAADRYASEGIRVLGVARGHHRGGGLPEAQTGFAFDLVGLVGFQDPLRTTVQEAVQDCRSAGIRVVMITGDYPATALAIAREAGIEATEAITGRELDRLTDAELAARLRGHSVFARIMPEQKLRIVSALKANGEVVAMTGDGVNDAPSLRASHIGIAMGGRGTDVAREASSIVLLDDDFGSIVQTIRLGRRIYDNLRKAAGYIFAVHVPIAVLALMPLLLGLPLVLTPLHIAFLEMVIDPVCSIVFEAEAEEHDVMERPPRPPDARLFSLHYVVWSVFQGMLAAGAVGAVLVTEMAFGAPISDVRAASFLALVLTNLALVLANRSFSASLAQAASMRNRALWVVIAVTAGMLAVVLYWPPARSLFRFGQLQAADLLFCAALACLVLLVLEAMKSRWRKLILP
ncbi:MAG: cation-translocating P-type ATPase [Alphaproteobacteria bacterium]|nr:cation-translocating P-type ATPase [Alphaproteobacteria bacterium]